MRKIYSILFYEFAWNFVDFFFVESLKTMMMFRYGGGTITIHGSGFSEDVFNQFDPILGNKVTKLLILLYICIFPVLLIKFVCHKIYTFLILSYYNIWYISNHYMIENYFVLRLVRTPCPKFGQLTIKLKPFFWHWKIILQQLVIDC